MLNYKRTQSKILTFDDLRTYYINSEKQCGEHKYGLEYERISINPKTLEVADHNNIEKIITTFSKIEGWKILRDGKTIIGASNKKSSISLEPGAQMELSLEPKKTVAEIKNEANEILKTLDNVARFYGVEFLPCGISPKSTHNNIKIVKKERYEIMAKTLPENGKFAPIMMRETAGVQLNIDYENEIDAIKKMKLLAKISPFLTGFFANSPIRNNKITNYKSFRALAWKYTGQRRCGVFYKNLIDSEKATFDDYINAILDVPMVFAQKQNKKIPLFERITFRQYLAQNEATLEDYLLQASLAFPDVRLKNCIEIRNHDSQNFEMALCICALYKGILNSELDEIFYDLQEVKAQDIENMGFLAAKHGVDFEYKNISAKKYVKKLFNIARKNLEQDEKIYLEAADEFLDREICVADKILEKGIKNSSQLYEYLKG